MKKILVVKGGGRPKGNTAQLIESFQKGAQAAGHAVEIVDLMKFQVNGCLGCNACRYGKPCVQRDDFSALLPKIMEADCIVLAAPLYYWTIPARLKAFLERFYSIAEEDPAPPKGRYEKYPAKDCALMMTSADDLFWTFSQASSYYDFAIVHYLGFHDRGKLLCGGCGGSLGAPNIQNTDHLKKAYSFGKTLYGDGE